MTPTLIITQTPTEAARIATARGLADGMWLHFRDLVSAGQYATRIGLRFGVTVDLVVAADPVSLSTKRGYDGRDRSNAWNAAPASNVSPVLARSPR